MKKYEKLSVTISALLGLLLLCALAFACFWVPTVVNSMIDATDSIGNRNQIGEMGRSLVIADVYAIIAVAAVAVVLMFALLRVVYKHRVFSQSTEKLLSAISLCCFGVGLLALLLITVFQLVVCVTIAACFLGLSLRVVKHVIKEATQIKCENDFTI